MVRLDQGHRVHAAWGFVVHQVVTDPQCRLRNITLEAHGDDSLPERRPEGVALVRVATSSAPNPLNHLKEPSCKRSPATRKLEGKWHKGLGSRVGPTLILVHLSAFGATGSASRSLGRAILRHALGAGCICGRDIQQEEAALGVHCTNRYVRATFTRNASLRVVEQIRGLQRRL